MKTKKQKTRRPLASAARTPQDYLPNDTVRKEWLRRVEAEYRSGAHAHHLTLWLRQLGAPPELINMGLRVVSDELVHAELSDQVYRAAGGSAAPTLPRESLALRRHPSEALEFDVLRVGVEMFCLGETIAVRLFGRLRDTELEPTVDKALERILRDEVFHRDFGWALLDWLLQTPMADAFRKQLARELPAMLKQVRDNHGGVALVDRMGAEALARLGAEMPAATSPEPTVATSTGLGFFPLDLRQRIGGWLLRPSGSRFRLSSRSPRTPESLRVEFLPHAANAKGTEIEQVSAQAQHGSQKG